MGHHTQVSGLLGHPHSEYTRKMVLGPVVETVLVDQTPQSALAPVGMGLQGSLSPLQFLHPLLADLVASQLVLEFFVGEAQDELFFPNGGLDEEEGEDGVDLVVDGRLNEINLDAIACDLVADQLSAAEPEVSQVLVLHFDPLHLLEPLRDCQEVDIVINGDWGGLQDRSFIEHDVGIGLVLADLELKLLLVYFRPGDDIRVCDFYGEKIEEVQTIVMDI
jgi:hypothetical protein